MTTPTAYELDLNRVIGLARRFQEARELAIPFVTSAAQLMANFIDTHGASLAALPEMLALLEAFLDEDALDRAEADRARAVIAKASGTKAS